MRAHISFDELIGCIVTADWALPPCADPSYTQTLQALDALAHQRVIALTPATVEQIVFALAGRTQTLTRFIYLIGA